MYLAIVIFLILSMYILIQGTTFKKEKKRRKMFKEGKFPLIFAHGGAKLMYPENTELAFEESFKWGVDGFEIDSRLTKDGELITHHNETIDETSDGKGLVRDYTLSEINSFNFGYDFKDIYGKMEYQEKREKVIPIRIEDLFIKYGNKVRYIIDIKDEGEVGKKAADILLSLIEKYKLEEWVCIAGFHDEILEYIDLKKSEKIITSGSVGRTKKAVISSYLGIDAFMNYNISGLQIPTFEILPLSTKYLINKLHRHNMFVQYWTINTEEEMENLIEKGVDGIITDRLDLAFNLKEKYNR